MKVWFSFDNNKKIVGVWWKGCVTKHNEWRKACKTLGAIKYNCYFINSYM